MLGFEPRPMTRAHALSTMPQVMYQLVRFMPSNLSFKESTHDYHLKSQM